MQTIMVLLILCGLIALAIYKILKNKNNGCSCGDCCMSDKCNKR